MRLERRSSALLLAAIPEGLREEVVSTKNITTLGILSKGLVQYQPGGLAERSAILAALENPQEAQTVGAAVATLRKWQRWKRRAEELKVSIPDPTLLAKGLGKLMKKVMSVPGAGIQVAAGEELIDGGFSAISRRHFKVC